MKEDENELIREFFNDMKAADRKTGVPDVSFRWSYNRRPGRRRFISIAAVITLLIISVFLIYRPKQEDIPERSISELEQDIEHMMSWQSATGELFDNQKDKN